MPTWDSFGLWTNDTLSTEFSGLYQLVHETDLSDNPQDFVLYLGSNLTDRILQTTTNPGVDDVELSIVDRLPLWDNATAYTVGQSIQPSTPNGYRYMCTTAGTSHASVEPTWPEPPDGVGTTVADGTAIWTFVGARHALTEIKLATTSGGLDTAVGGDPLTLSNTIEGGDAEAVEIHIRVTNAVNIVSNNAGTPEIGLNFNECTETAIVPS